MTVSLLSLVREKQAEATREVLVRWRKKRIPRLKQDRARLANEVSQLIDDHIARHSDDRAMVRELVRRPRDTPDDIDQVNEFLQRYLGLVVSVGRVLRAMADKFEAAGLRIHRLALLDTAIAEGERLREDLPEQLALAFHPIRSVLHERVANALKTPPRATNWRSLLK
jgi:hypothetical protein